MTTTIILDQFTGTNGTDITAHTIAPTNVPSTSWTFDSGATSSWQIESNHIEPDGNYQTENPGREPSVDAGYSDCTVSCTVTWGVSDTNQDSDVTFRYQDWNNFFLCTCFWTNNTFAIYEKVSGSFNLITSTPVTFSVGDVCTITVVLSGTSISATLSGSHSASLSATSSDFETKTRFGMRCAGDNHKAGMAFDNFTITIPTTAKTYGFAGIGGIQGTGQIGIAL